MKRVRVRKPMAAVWGRAVIHKSLRIGEEAGEDLPESRGCRNDNLKKKGISIELLPSRVSLQHCRLSFSGADLLRSTQQRKDPWRRKIIDRKQGVESRLWTESSRARLSLYQSQIKGFLL